MKKHCVSLPGLTSPSTWSKQVTTAFKSAKLNTMFVTLGWWLPPREGAILSSGVLWEHFWFLPWVSSAMPSSGWRPGTPVLRGYEHLGVWASSHTSHLRTTSEAML